MRRHRPIPELRLGGRPFVCFGPLLSQGEPSVEATETLASPAAEAAESQPAASEESASSSSEATTAQSNAFMNAMLRGQLAEITDPASKSDTADADDDADSESDGVSASSGDVKPSDAPTQGKGRRGSAAEISRLAAENARLQQTLEQLQPKLPDASEEARTAAIEAENRYRRLLVKPDSDYDWTHDDIQFLADEKQKRALVPELRRHYDTVLEADLKARETEFASKHQGFQQYVLQGMAAVKDLPGVDFDAVKAAPDFVARERLIYAAGAASNESEIKSLRDENAQLKREMLGSTRAPLNGGRSSPGRTYDPNDVMNTLIRGGRA